MSSHKSKEHENLIPNALMQFWEYGYYGTSVDDLVKATGLSRSSLYSKHKNKKELFKECLRFYTNVLVDESVGYMEEPEANLDAVQKYFDWVLVRLEKQSPPFKGCFIGNTMSESSPHDQEFHEIVEQFNIRLSKALYNVLKNETKSKNVDDKVLKQISQSLMTSIHGIWVYSRSVKNFEDLTSAIDGFMLNARSMVVRIAS